MARRTIGYTSAEAAAISGLTPAMVDYLARTRVVAPTVEGKPGRGRPRIYSFGDLVALRTLKALLKAGVDVSNLRKGIACLQKTYGRSLTTCPADFLFTDGKSLYLRSGTEPVSDVSKGGQFVFLFMCDLRHLDSETRKDARAVLTARREAV
jgi:DNA-binding transcriptional MerR regulator